MTVELPSYVAGRAVTSNDLVPVYYPWDGSQVGSVHQIGVNTLDEAIAAAVEQPIELTRYERHSILRRAAKILAERRDQIAELIRLESGLCARDTLYETGRSADVLEFAAIEALRDDGQVYSCDISPQGKSRKIFTFRQPVALMSAITPFNHPLNQVVHKLAPAVAAGVPILLKPSEKTPLTAIRFSEILYEAGLPGPMLSVFLGDLDTVARKMVTDHRVELVSFTGSVGVGKQIAGHAGYKKLCLELGGNSPLIVLEDADLDLAVRLAAEGSFRNSGQRCTAVKRILVQQSILERFTERFVRLAGTYTIGDPASMETRVGTVIDAPAAQLLERRVEDAVARGAVLRLGGRSDGAVMEPTVVTDVPRDAELVAKESFGPIAPILPIADLDDAIEYYNSGQFALSSAIVTTNLDAALVAVRRLRCGTTNVNEVPGYRIEGSPFGGVKGSGLGVKEGVIEAIKFMTNIKTFSLPW